MIGLIRCVGTGTDADPFRPDLDTWVGAIDLRPDPTVAQGWWLARNTGGFDTILGDDLDARLSASIRNKIGNRLGITLNDQPLRRLILDILLAGDDASPSKWNRLVAGRDGMLRVFLGEEIFTLPVPAGGSVFTENFNTADSTTVGPNLSWTEVVGDWSVVSNQMNLVTSTGNNYARAEADVSSADHYVQATVVTLTTTTDIGGVCARFSSSATTAYIASMRRNAATTWRIRKVVTGTVTDLTNVSDTAPTAGSTLKLVCNGSSLEMFYAGVSESSVTDTSITTGTRGGFSGVPTGGNRVKFDDFEIGDLAAAATSPPLRNQYTRRFHMLVR